MLRVVIILFAMLALTNGAVSQDLNSNDTHWIDEERLKDPELERRAIAITQQLRCPTCVSQSVESSDVETSLNLKRLVREKLLAGDKDREILDYVASRYGDYVLLKPRMNAVNIFLWFFPGLLFITIMTFFIIRKNQNLKVSADNQSLDSTEKEALDDILKVKKKISHQKSNK